MICPLEQVSHRSRSGLPACRTPGTRPGGSERHLCVLILTKPAGWKSLSPLGRGGSGTQGSNLKAHLVPPRPRIGAWSLASCFQAYSFSPAGWEPALHSCWGKTGRKLGEDLWTSHLWLLEQRCHLGPSVSRKVCCRQGVPMAGLWASHWGGS